MFYDTEKRQADFRIRLEYDGFNQSTFFRAILTGYLDKDHNILSYLDKYKQENSMQGINKRKSNERLYAKGEKTKRIFNLKNNEIDDIFDIIAEEHPDL